MFFETMPIKELVSYVPLQDGWRQHGARPKHSVAVDVKTSGTVTVDHSSTARLPLHDWHRRPLVQFVVTRSKSVGSGEKGAGEGLGTSKVIVS